MPLLSQSGALVKTALTALAGAARLGIGAIHNLQETLDAKQPLSTVLTNTTASYTTAEATKVAGIDAALATKQPLATVLTNTTASYTTTLNTKLTGIATGATNNGTTATLLARANHTGTQAISTITDLQTTLNTKISSDGSILSRIKITQAAYDALPVKVETTEYVIVG